MRALRNICRATQQTEIEDNGIWKQVWQATINKIRERVPNDVQKPRAFELLSALLVNNLVAMGELC